MKPKILILQKIIPSYRYPLFSELNKTFDITVGYHKKIHGDELDFKTQKINSITIHKIFLPTFKFIKMCREYDSIIIMLDFHFINYCILPFVLTQPKIISWSIGMRASYTLPYDVMRKKTFLDVVFGYILNKCSANIFYYNHPLKFWGEEIDHNKVFVAFNTVDVRIPNKITNNNKDSILFLGSLIKGKGLWDLVKSFKRFIEKNRDSNLILNIIGDGPEFKVLDRYIIKNNFSHRIFLRGAIFDDYVLKNYFERAICLISPGQAGLTVLKSFAYGIPFVTKYNAITGGERLNIVNETNGLLYKKENELDQILETCMTNLNSFKRMGINAYNFYWKEARMERMLEGFKNAINLALEIK